MFQANAFAVNAFQIGDVAGVASPVIVEPPSVGFGGGGGPEARFYRGKYRGELRRTIIKAAKSLSGNKKRRKRVSSDVLSDIRQAVDFERPVTVPVSLAAEFATLEAIRLQMRSIVSVLQELPEKRRNDDLPRLRAVIDAYLSELDRLDRQEEEAIATILLLGV